MEILNAPVIVTALTTLLVVSITMMMPSLKAISQKYSTFITSINISKRLKLSVNQYIRNKDSSLAYDFIKRDLNIISPSTIIYFEKLLESSNVNMELKLAIVDVYDAIEKIRVSEQNFRIEAKGNSIKLIYDNIECLREYLDNILRLNWKIFVKWNIPDFLVIIPYLIAIILILLLIAFVILDTITIGGIDPTITFVNCSNISNISLRCQAI